MTSPTSPTIHASAVLVGARAVLIRGASGAGKSRLALELLEAGAAGHLRLVRLIGDDRVRLTSAGGRLLVRPAPQLAGLIELRGTGIVRLDYEPCAVVGLVVDLAAADAERLPEKSAIVVDGVELRRLAVAPGAAPLPTVLAALGAYSGAVAHPYLPVDAGVHDLLRAAAIEVSARVSRDELAFG
ncbi:MAG: HPr kinase/phosphatase C-terminal domain-containing protein [Xanthobacteraceae bacterium]